MSCYTVAGDTLRVVCEIFFFGNKVHAAQSAAGRKPPLRPAGDLGGGVSYINRGSGQRSGKF